MKSADQVWSAPLGGRPVRAVLTVRVGGEAHSPRLPASPPRTGPRHSGAGHPVAAGSRRAPCRPPSGRSSHVGSGRRHGLAASPAARAVGRARLVRAQPSITAGVFPPGRVGSLLNSRPRLLPRRVSWGGGFSRRQATNSTWPVIPGQTKDVAAPARGGPTRCGQNDDAGNSKATGTVGLTFARSSDSAVRGVDRCP
jgi:hypothetical protein